MLSTKVSPWHAVKIHSAETPLQFLQCHPISIASFSSPQPLYEVGLLIYRFQY
uniref:Uncharacterized protein n=1 Tax=Arundo donax TaxID=35708 RepID=A0A0A9DTI2_ARUDO